METKFTEQESLTLISEMIKQARSNFKKGGGNSMVFFGVLVSVIAILNIILVLWNIYPNLSYSVWYLMIPGGIVGHLITKKVERESMVRTHLDAIISTTWKGYAYSIYIFLIVIFCIGFGKKMYDFFYLINPVILILLGLAEFVAAKVYRFKPYLYGAIIMWIGALACIAAMWGWEPTVIQFAILVFCMIFGFVVPGYKLNKLAKNS